MYFINPNLCVINSLPGEKSGLFYAVVDQFCCGIVQLATNTRMAEIDSVKCCRAPLLNLPVYFRQFDCRYYLDCPLAV
jgi:hypothetical protein